MTQIHRGEILSEAIKKSDIQITTICEKLGKPRSSLYNHFKNKDLSIDILIAVGKIIKHDFSAEIPELKKFINRAEEPQMHYGREDETDESWKRKYFELLEKHTSTLTELNRFIRADKKNKS